jgi:RNA polymerase sigma factor (sigma-70 family)
MRSGSLVHALTIAVADASVPDGELLARFAGTGDSAAFELLVLRHAELVWKVCRGELPGDRHSAEDAFQTTFLVLARKAGAVREASAAGFLFRVARNAAMRVRRRIGSVAEAVADIPAEASTDPVEADECSAVVVAEVQRLPDKFRLPVLLCFFEGCSHTEAADRLGWAVGTVASRLARAKDRLRDRLSSRGVVLPAVLASAGVSASMVRATVVMATTPSGMPAGISELTREVLNAMWNAKAKLIGGGVLAVLLAGGLGLMTLTAGSTPIELKVPTPDELKVKDKSVVKLPEKPEETELKKLQGMWRVTRLENERGVAPADVIEPMRWEIVGTTITAQNNPAEKQKQQMQIAVDPTKSPKQITLTYLSGPGQVGNKAPGIYELKDNKLRICLVDSGKSRPTEFKVDKTDDSGLIELERIIPDTIRDLKDLTGEWRVLSVERDGVRAKGAERVTYDFHRDVAWMIDGDNVVKMVVVLDAPKGLIDLTAIVNIEPEKAKERVLLGRFTWKDDKLTLILGAPGAERPAEANSGKDANVIVMERAAK